MAICGQIPAAVTAPLGDDGLHHGGDDRLSMPYFRLESRRLSSVAFEVPGAYYRPEHGREFRLPGTKMICLMQPLAG